jgi:hypothetical protein
VSATEQVQPRGTQHGKPTRWDRVRDGLTFLGAWVIIGYQMLMVEPKDVNETFLFLAAGLLGVPFGAEALARLRGSGGSGITDSGSSPSSSPSPQSSA